MFLVATYTDGQPTENAEWFCKWLEEASTDFRYGKTFLKGLRYAVFGLGNSVYAGHYNTVREGFLRLQSGVQRLSEAAAQCFVVQLLRIQPAVSHPGGYKRGQVAVDAERQASHDQGPGRLQRGEEP